jgi:hypothetical protein
VVEVGVIDDIDGLWMDGEKEVGVAQVDSGLGRWFRGSSLVAGFGDWVDGRPGVRVDGV